MGMLDVISKILSENIPSTNETKCSLLTEIMAQRKSQCKAMVSMIVKQLLHLNDHQLNTNIEYCLENKNTLNTDSNYQYECMLMHLGAMSYNHDMLMNLQQVMKTSKFSKLTEDSQHNLKDYALGLQVLETKHATFVADMLENVKDEKIKIKIKSFRQNECLFDVPQHKYEYFLRIIGTIVYGYEDPLEKV